MIIYGKQLILHVLEKYPEKFQTVYLAKKCPPKLFSSIAKVCDTIVRVDNQKAQALARGGNHQGFLAQIEPLEFSDFSVLKRGKFVIVLDGLSDVGNIGAIIRSAYAFGADGLIISGVKSINIEGVIRTSAAAAFELPLVLSPSTLDVANELKQVGFTLYGAHMEGHNAHEVAFDARVALFMGSEGDGLHKRVKEKLDTLVCINMAREFDSLNVSAATAILCDRIANG